MSKSVSVTLGQNTYDVPQFQLRQHMKIIDVLHGEAEHVPFGVLGIALQRCNVAEVMDLDASLDEIREATLKILRFAGYTTQSSDPAPVALAQAVQEARDLNPASFG